MRINPKCYTADKECSIDGTRSDARYFDEQLEEIREIPANERMTYRKITHIYPTAINTLKEYLTVITGKIGVSTTLCAGAREIA
jgi:hypothetical protein